jgi:hypothetical protein
MLFRTRPNRAELDATKIPSAIDIAWAAGVYEGEGCARLCGRGKRSFAIHVVQKDPEILYRLRDWFGGSVTMATVRGEFAHYAWNICGDRARVFIAQIYTFLSARRKLQVDETKALDFLEGQSLIGISAEQVKAKLTTHYAYHNATTWRDPENRRRMVKERYASDEAYREKKKLASRKTKERQREKNSENAKVVAIA